MLFALGDQQPFM